MVIAKAGCLAHHRYFPVQYGNVCKSLMYVVLFSGDKFVLVLQCVLCAVAHIPVLYILLYSAVRILEMEEHIQSFMLHSSRWDLASRNPKVELPVLTLWQSRWMLTGR